MLSRGLEREKKKGGKRARAAVAVEFNLLSMVFVVFYNFLSLFLSTIQLLK